MKHILIIFSAFLMLNVVAQNAFKFDKLKLLSEGKDLVSMELESFENLTIVVFGIENCNDIEGKSELGMEILVTDENANQLMFNPDMLENLKLSREDLTRIQFNFELSAAFVVGNNYFIKVRMWDKLTNTEFTKETSIKVLPPLTNKFITVKDNGFKYLANRLYVSGSRYYEGDMIRRGDELYFDLFMESMQSDVKMSIEYQMEFIDVSTNKSYPVESEILVVPIGDELSNLNYTVAVRDELFVSGKNYIFKMHFKNNSTGNSLTCEYAFKFFENDWKVNTELLSNGACEALKNQEKTKSGTIVNIGDRLDFELSKIENFPISDKGFSKLGATLILYDAKGVVISESGDLFSDLGVAPTRLASEVSLHYTIPWNIESNTKYSVESILWDKYSLKRYSKKFNFKTAKTIGLAYGLKENPFLKYTHDAKKVKPLSIVLFRNGYKYQGNELNIGDEIVLRTACEMLEGISSVGYTTLIQIVDADGNILSESKEPLKDFEIGDLFATLTVPEEGIQFGKNIRLLLKMMDFREDVVTGEYTFVIVK